MGLLDINDKIWWKWALYGTFCNHKMSDDLCRKMGIKKSEIDFLLIGIVQWSWIQNFKIKIFQNLKSKINPEKALFALHLIVTNISQNDSGIQIIIIFEICLWIYYIACLIRLRFRFNRLVLEDHCLLMRYLF